MPLTLEQQTDLKRAYDALQGKQKEYNLLWRYYDGDHPLVYSTERLEEIFRDLNRYFQTNWCATVIDAALERINLSSFTVTDNPAATDALNSAWTRTEMNLDSDDAHTAALVVGEAYIIAWRDEETGELEAFYNDPRLCHIFYESENPRRKQFAAKWWVDDGGKFRMTLYYADRIEYYITEKAAREVSSHNSFIPLGDVTGDEMDSIAPNPFGKVPVFHLRKERRKVKSELINAIPIQDAVNKLMADMMVAAEFGAFKQRYIISSMDNLGQLKNAPNEIWDIPAAADGEQATTVGELTSTDLGNYLSAIDQLSISIGIVTRTPKQYFFQASTSNISGEALVALEAPLVKKCERHIERFKATWQKVAAFLLELQGIIVDPMDIMPMFDRPETVQPLTGAQVRKTNVDAGMPLRYVLQQEGATQQELEQFDQAKAEEQSAVQSGLAAALLNAQTQFDGGQGVT